MSALWLVVSLFRCFWAEMTQPRSQGVFPLLLNVDKGGKRESLGLSLQMTQVRVAKPWLNNVNDKTFLVISYEFLSSGTVNKPG